MKLLNLSLTFQNISSDMPAGTAWEAFDALYAHEIRMMEMLLKSKCTEGYHGFSYKGVGITTDSSDSIISVQPVNSSHPEKIATIKTYVDFSEEMYTISALFIKAASLDGAANDIAATGIMFREVTRNRPSSIKPADLRLFQQANQKGIQTLKKIRTRQLLLQIPSAFPWGDTFEERPYKSLFEGK